MKKIAITGANGVIGTVLRNGLTDYQITPLDLPEFDARQYGSVLEGIMGHDAVIHLAWDTVTDRFDSGKTNPENAMMFSNVYKAAVEAGVNRVIMASSVHANRYADYSGSKKITVNDTPIPDSPYGAHKIFLETLGRYYAKEHDLEVVCVRFGGVTPDDKVIPDEQDPGFSRIYLSQRDCNSFIKTCLDAPNIPNKFMVSYAISNNANRVHDFANPLNWEPQDDPSKKI